MHQVLSEPSLTFWDIVLHIVLAQTLNGEKSLKFSDPDPNLHQNWIHSSLLHTQPAHQGSSESIHNFLKPLLYVVFIRPFNGKESVKKILRSTSGSSPKSNQFGLVTYPSSTPNPSVTLRCFVHKQIGRHRQAWKHHLHQPSVAEVTNTVVDTSS